MAQTRNWNFKADDATKDINRWLTGILSSGVYFGFDFSPTANMNLQLVHTSTGFKDVGDGAVPAESPFTGLIVTRQGVFIKEDADLDVLPINVGNGSNPRIDTIIVTHKITEVAGGTQALYSVITGTPSATPVAPALTVPTTQTKIGEIYIPTNTTALNQPGVKWTKVKPGFAGDQFATAETNDLNDVQRSGYFYTSGSPSNRPVSAAGTFMAMVSSLTNQSQLYITASTNQVYFRNKVAGVWSSWIELTAPLSGVTGAITTVLTSNLTANRVVVSNASGKIIASSILDSELNHLVGLTVDVQTKFNALDSTDSSLQTQINGKQATITGAITTVLSSDLTANRVVVSNGSGKVIASSVLDTELNQLTGIGTGSTIQSQLNGKQANITGAITTVLSSDLTANRVVVSNGSGKVIASGILDSELNQLAGINTGSTIQSQINAVIALFDDRNQSWTALPFATNWSGALSYKLTTRKTVKLRGQASSSIAVADGTLIGTLPAGFRPGGAGIEFVPVSYLFGGAGNYQCYITIFTDGRVFVYLMPVSAGAAGTFLYVNLEFEIA